MSVPLGDAMAIREANQYVSSCIESKAVSVLHGKHWETFMTSDPE